MKHKSIKYKYAYRMLDLANVIEKGEDINGHEVKFNLSEWVYNDEYGWDNGNPERNICGTVACIAGAAAIISNPEDFSFDGNKIKFGLGIIAEEKFKYFMKVGREYLGLNNKQAKMLFIPDVIRGEVRPAEAANVMRQYVKTGKIDWTEVSEKDFGKYG
jgi:hypothetical protein